MYMYRHYIISGLSEVYLRSIQVYLVYARSI